MTRAHLHPSPGPRLGRRRVLAVAAAAAGCALLPAMAAPAPRREAPALHAWHGRALGADAHLLLHDPDARRARDLLRRCVAEMRRLESIFSLHRPDSALSRLNRDGVLMGPPPELVALLAESRRYGALTQGAFDVTVQPLWDLYLAHFAEPDADPDGPAPRDIARALARVGYADIRIASGMVCLARDGMAVTLNGVAQGYITDRITDLLAAAGLRDVLVNLGEYRALGSHPAGRPWRIGLADPGAPERASSAVSLRNRALATSGGYGMAFDASGRHHHLFDPRTGRSCSRYRSVSVLAPRAAMADALSTALSVLAPGAVQGVLDAVGSATAILSFPDGRTEVRGPGRG